MKRSRLKRKNVSKPKHTKKILYYSGIHQNVGNVPNAERKAVMTQEAGIVRKRIMNLLDMFSLKTYKGETPVDRENLCITVFRDKKKHFDFLSAYTTWKAQGMWRENGKVYDDPNAILEVQFADTPSEAVGRDLIKLLNRYNELVVGEKLLYAYTTPVEETSL
jgi:hypothetical protein